VVDLGEVFRSPLVASILTTLTVERGEWTAEELAAQTGAAYQTVTKEIRRLEKAGAVSVVVVGRTKFVTAKPDDVVMRALGRALALATAQEGGDPMAKKKDKKKKGKKGKKK